jgi:hypothetical protein
VLSLAGCNQVRDVVDLRVISDVLSRKYASYLHSQSEVGGWPELNTYKVPTDTDHDGLPDYWETALGQNPCLANNNHTNADGYTDLEHYLNWLAELHAIAAEGSPVDVNLRTFTVGLANNATYMVSNPTNGTVSLLGDGRTARFVPTPGFTGLGGFQFTGTDALAGGGMTNTVAVVVTQPVPTLRFTDITAGPGELVLRGEGGPPCGKLVLLSATNPVLPASTWARIATNQFDAAGNFQLTHIPPAGTAVLFYRLQVP